MTDFPALKAAKDAQAKIAAELKGIFEQAGADLDMSKVKTLDGDNASKVGRIRELNLQLNAATEDVKAKKELYNIAESTREQFLENADADQDESPRGGKGMSLGRAFVQSRAVKEYRGGQGPVADLDVDVKTLFARNAGWEPESTRSGRLELTPMAPAVQVVNYIPTAPISQAAYKYMEETTFTNNAATRAEGAIYGEAALALTERNKIVESLAVWMPITDEQLEDVDGAEAYVNNRLTTMIQIKLDSQVLTGNGTTPNLLGTENVSGIQVQAKGADTTMDAALKLFTLIRTDGWAEPSAAFIAHSKWQEIVLLKTADGQYIWGHPSAVGPSTLWGVPVTPTNVNTSSKLVAGDYATYSLLGIRRGISTQVTNAHSDFFIYGKQAIRADMRAVMVHFRPKAFGTVTGL